jgi:hypothetical protein
MMRFLALTRRNFTGSGISDSVATVTFELRDDIRFLGFSVRRRVVGLTAGNWR